MATMNYQLEVWPNNKIPVPNYEPTSDITSKSLSVFLSKMRVGLVDLNVALAAIPGSYVKWGVDFSRSGARQRWFVLPPYDLGCPCSHHDDYYKILKDLAQIDEPITESYDMCDVNDMGYCPSPEFDTTPAPPPNPYQDEGGAAIFGSGVLPPVPPWMLNQ